MDDDDFLALRKRVDGLRKEHRRKKSKDYPPSAELLEGMLSHLDPLAEDAITLRSFLSDEYSVYGLLDKWEGLLRYETEIFRDEPVPWISLAGFFLYAKGDLEEALAATDIAVCVAEKKREWVRHAFCTRGRIARAMHDYRLLEDTLEYLIAYKPPMGSIDIHLEHDFVVTLPPGKINEDLLAKYNALKSVKTGPFRSQGPGTEAS